MSCQHLWTLGACLGRPKTLDTPPRHWHRVYTYFEHRQTIYKDTQQQESSDYTPEMSKANAYTPGNVKVCKERIGKSGPEYPMETTIRFENPETNFP